MAKVHGIAGEWARVYGVVIGLWPLFLSVFIGGFAVALAIFFIVEWGMLLIAVAFMFAVWSWIKGFRKVERFFVGARGEERVSEILKKLPESYHVFNDFVIGRRHVDHVIVGPAGVFAVETKCWSGKVTIEDGHLLVGGELPDRSPLSQVKREAEDVKRALIKDGWRGDVTPILVFASDTFEAQGADFQGAVILNSKDVLSRFESANRVVLETSELERLIKIIELRG